MAFADLSDEDFLDILPPAPKAEPDLIMSVVRMGRQKAPRLQFLFQPGVISEIGGVRYRVGYAPAKRMIRIQADDRGPYETTPTPRGKRLILRCPMPAGLNVVEASEEPEFYVDAVGRAILVEVAEAFFRPASKPALPAPSASAPAQSPARAADPPAGFDPVLAATLGLTARFPRRIGDVDLTVSEARILEVLYRRQLASIDALMMATADDVEEDERGSKIIDVMIHKLRRKLAPIGVEISNIRGEGYALPAGAKSFLSTFVDKG